MTSFSRCADNGNDPVIILRISQPNDIGNERIEALEHYIDEIMNALQKKYDKEVMKEYFQNHVKKLEFKI